MRRGPHLEAGANRYGPRVPAPNRHELNHLSPSADTPGATLPCVRGAFLQTPNGTATGLVGVGNLVLPLDCRELRHISPQGRAQLRISLRSELAGDPAEDCAESLGSIASIIGVRHPSRMESVDGKVWSEE
jgi:hypothetical protein